MNTLIVDIPSEDHGHLRLRYAGTLYLPLLLAHPSGFEHYESLHPSKRFATRCVVVAHIPEGEEPLRMAPKEASSPCLDIWVCTNEDNPHASQAGVPLIKVGQWQAESVTFRRDDLRQEQLPQNATAVKTNTPKTASKQR